ncbi:MAG: DUF362 domain-containing protein [Deltaproteobacteria bacterium]|nr:DUF362 domain-containing protein [Deltaproteobacteria bacterium]
MQLYINKAEGLKEIKERVSEVFKLYEVILPESREASIFLKPNLNANMNALTGNTTDLRLLAAVIEELKGRGYNNITIGEGTNSGYYRHGISVISRLKVDALAGYHGVKVIDLNYSEPHLVEFEDGVKASVARDVVDADFLINIPKLKTHFEAGMSVCLKNMMGCLIGQENKKKTHKSLARNILHINEYVKPCLHIVDGLIAMEGLGPTRGMPVKTGLIIAGTDPYLIDLTCARVAKFDYKKVVTLRVAEALGRLTQEHHSYVNSLDIKDSEREFAPPTAGFLATFIHSPKRQKYFLAIRNTRLFNYICSTKIAGKILYATGLRQDVFIDDEMHCESLSIDWKKCTRCGKCDKYCPVGIKLPDDLDKKGNGCIHCLYCFMICPEKAIIYKGKLGFVSEQLRQYDEIVRKIA